MGEPRKATKVFISYAHEDEAYKDELLLHLASLRHQGVIATWHDREIHAGAEWSEEIRTQIDTADMVLLLVSADFIASDFCREVEMVRALERHERREARVIPVILRPCDWMSTPLAKLQALPRTGTPVVTWRQRDEAWLNIATGIRFAIEGPTARPAWSTASRTRPAALHQLRAPPPDFTGREEELADLRARLGSGSAIIAGLTGQGGVGKTALALKLAAELRASYPDAQIDIDLRGADAEPLRTADVMAEVIHAFEPERRLPDAPDALGKVYRSVLAGKRALLLFDNAHDRAQVEPLLPPQGCFTLVTSRQHFVLPGIYTRRLDTLAEGDAVALVQSIAPRLDEAETRDLAKLCGYLPFALRAAACVLAEQVDLKPARYLEQLRSAERVKLVETVLASSLELLDATGRAIWMRLGVMPADFDICAAAAVGGGIGIEEAEKRLSEFVRQSVLDWDQATERYRLHDLARDYARSRLDMKERYAAERCHAEHFLRVAGAANARYMEGGVGVIEGLRAFDQAWPHITATQAWTVAHAETDVMAATICHQLIFAVRAILSLRQCPRGCINWLESALPSSRLVGLRAEEGRLIGDLGNAYADLHEPQKAIHFHEQHLTIAREVGDCHGENRALGNLAADYRSCGEYRKAIELYEQSLTIAREIGDRQGESNTLGNLGNAFSDLGELQKAIEFYEQGLTIARDIGLHDGQHRIISNMGLAYVWSGKLIKGIEILRRSVESAREISNRQQEARGLAPLTLALFLAGKVRKSEESFDQYISIVRDHSNRRDEAHITRLLSLLYALYGNLHRAVELNQAATEIHRELGVHNLSDREAETAMLLRLSRRPIVVVILRVTAWVLFPLTRRLLLRFLKWAFTQVKT